MFNCVGLISFKPCPESWHSIFPFQFQLVQLLVEFCVRKTNKNVKNKLKDIGVSKTDKTRILTDIFGSTGDISLKMTGLTDCFTHAEFDQKLDQLKLKWENAVPEYPLTCF
jgi:hypothetical protein